MLPQVNERVFKEPVDIFCRRNPRLAPIWDRLQKDALANAGLKGEIGKFLEGSIKGGGSREVGSRRPDLVEFFMDQGDVVVTDIVYSNDGNYLRVHAFKTEFYRAVLQSMLGGRGPRVSGLDLNLRTVRPTSIVSP